MRNETKEMEWQKPTDYQVYNNNSEMYEIELKDGSTLLVSPEHTVYGLVKPRRESNNSLGENTRTGDNLFSTLSPENIVYPNTKEVILYIQ